MIKLIKYRALYIFLFVIIAIIISLVYYFNIDLNKKSYILPNSINEENLNVNEENNELLDLKTLYKNKKLLVLTFDDGPHKNTTTKLVEEMHKRNIPVTFFILGQNVVRK